MSIISQKIKTWPTDDGRSVFCFGVWKIWSKKYTLLTIFSNLFMAILFFWFLLIIYGIFAIYSVSIHESFSLTLRLVDAGLMTEPSNYFYFQRQFLNALISIVLGWIVFIIPLKFLVNKKFIVAFFLMMAAFQLLVFTPIGIELNGARWWLVIPWFGTVQPSEFFKLWFVIFLSRWLIRKQKLMTDTQFYIAFVVLLGIIFAVYLMIPDLGTILVLGLTALVMCRYAWARFIYLALIVVAWLVIGVGVGMQFRYVEVRLRHYLTNDVDPQNRGIWRQTHQAMIAIGWWWFRWKWYGKWLQKFGYIPEAQSDFIFAAFSEEVGFFGNMILLFLYGGLAFVFMKELDRVNNHYLRIVGVGLISMIIMQMFVNIGVNTKILPLTGLTLPFVSAWWTALMVNVIQVVLMYKIIYWSQKIWQI